MTGVTKIKFPTHDPYSLILPWLYEINKIPREKIPDALKRMKPHIKEARKKFRESLVIPLGYEDKIFRGVYLIAYFPYNIEPVFYALANSSINFSTLIGDKVTAAFFGGGPCPELLGLCTFLKRYYPRIRHIEALIFDREKGWDRTHRALKEKFLPYYWGKTIELRQIYCNIVKCKDLECFCEEDLSKTDIIIAQNILTEVYRNREKCIETFKWIFQISSNKIAVFVDSINNEISKFMSDISETLYKEHIIRKQVTPKLDHIKPNFSIPDILQKFIFDGSDGLILKKYVKFNSLVISKE